MAKRSLIALLLILPIAACDRGGPAVTSKPAAAPPAPPPAPHSHPHGAPPAADADPMAGPAVASADSERVEVVNQYCPLLVGQSVGTGKRCERSMTRRLGDRLVGFCDADCVKAWDGMSEQRRQELLDEALALEAPAKNEPKPGH